MKTTLLFEENAQPTALCRLLDDTSYYDFRFAVAYVRTTGVKILASSVRNLLDRDGSAQGVVGVDQGSTSYQGLLALTDLLGDQLYLRWGKGGRTVFHPKVYILKKLFENSSLLSIFVGSSNMTRGGLVKNEECNILFEDIPEVDDFSHTVENFWSDLCRTSEKFQTIHSTPALLKKLLDSDMLVDEEKTIPLQRPLPDQDRIELLEKIVWEATPPHQHRYFAMLIGGFDVSKKSADPVILIPKIAREENPSFWFWPNCFMPRGKYLELYLNVKVHIDGQQHMERVRLYNYPNRSEFRMSSKLIKRNGTAGDILVVERHKTTMTLSLVKAGDSDYSNFSQYLRTKVPNSQNKRYGYFNL